MFRLGEKLQRIRIHPKSTNWPRLGVQAVKNLAQVCQRITPSAEERVNQLQQAVLSCMTSVLGMVQMIDWIVLWREMSGSAVALLEIPSPIMIRLQRAELVRVHILILSGLAEGIPCRESAKSTSLVGSDDTEGERIARVDPSESAPAISIAQ